MVWINSARINLSEVAGNGRKEVYDTNQNGRNDKVLINDNHVGTTKQAYFDTNEDGLVDVLYDYENGKNCYWNADGSYTEYYTQNGKSKCRTDYNNDRIQDASWTWSNGIFGIGSGWKLDK